MNNSISLFFFIGLIFSPLAAACAFIITYEEYKHHLIDKKQVFKHSFQMAVFTFMIFLAISLVTGFFFSNMFASQ